MLIGYAVKTAEEDDLDANPGRGIFIKYDIREITVPFIAYTVVMVRLLLCLPYSLSKLLKHPQVRFALSDDEKLCMTDGGKHSYQALYKSVLKIMYDMAPKDRNAILEVWQT